MKIKTKNYNLGLPRVPTKAMLKQVRDGALQEAIDVINMWKADCEKDFAKHSKHGDLRDFGKINLLDLCIQRIREKIEGFRRWS